MVGVMLRNSDSTCRRASVRNLSHKRKTDSCELRHFQHMTHFLLLCRQGLRCDLIRGPLSCRLLRFGRHTHRHTDTQTHRHTDTQTHRHTDTQTHIERETDRTARFLRTRLSHRLPQGIFWQCSCQTQRLCTKEHLQEHYQQTLSGAIPHLGKVSPSDFHAGGGAGMGAGRRWSWGGSMASGCFSCAVLRTPMHVKRSPLWG